MVRAIGKAGIKNSEPIMSYSDPKNNSALSTNTHPIANSIANDQNRTADEIDTYAKIFGIPAIEAQARLENADRLFNAAGDEIRLSQIAKSLDIPIDVARSRAKDEVKKRLDLDLDLREYAKYREKLTEIDKIQDPEFREFKFQKLLKEFNLKQPIELPEPEFGADEVATLLEIQRSEFNVETLLPSLTGSLKGVARGFNLPAQCGLATLLPTAASRLHPEIRLRIDYGNAFYVPAILWFVTIGTSGSGKSPLASVSLRPLQKIQQEENEAFKFKKENYDYDLEHWEKTKLDERSDKPTEPKKINHLVDDFTIERLVEIVSQQPDRGLLVEVDEFTSLIGSFDRYSGGKGGDRGKFLSLYDGKPISVSRKSGDRYAPKSSVSIVTTTQPSILTRLMKANQGEVDGFWTRPLYMNVPKTLMPAPGEVPSIDVSDRLYGIYKRLSEFKLQTIEFSPEAKNIWTAWHYECEELKMGCSSESLESMRSKNKEHAARVALVAHCIEAAANGHEPSSEISGNTLMASIDFVRHCAGFGRMIFAMTGDTEDSPEALQIVRFVDRFKNMTIDYKQVRAWLPRLQDPKSRKLRKQTKAECLDFMRSVEKLKYGKMTEDKLEVFSQKKFISKVEF